MQLRWLVVLLATLTALAAATYLRSSRDAADRPLLPTTAERSLHPPASADWITESSFQRKTITFVPPGSDPHAAPAEVEVETLGPLGDEAVAMLMHDVAQLNAEEVRRRARLREQLESRPDDADTREAYLRSELNWLLRNEKLRLIAEGHYLTLDPGTASRDYLVLVNQLHEQWHLAMMSPLDDGGVEKVPLLYVPYHGTGALYTAARQLERFRYSVLQAVCDRFNALPRDMRCSVIQHGKPLPATVADGASEFPRGVVVADSKRCKVRVSDVITAEARKF